MGDDQDTDKPDDQRWMPTFSFRITIDSRVVNNGAAKPIAVAKPSDSTLTARNQQGSVSACASWRIPVVMGYAPGCFRGMKRDAVPGMSINGGQASV